MTVFVPNWTSDIAVRSVKDFGAVGDGSHDDTTAIQTAIDICFGAAGSPHGTNATLNQPLFFPNGTYFISAPLVFTQVRGARIYGAGQQATTIDAHTTGAVTTNGMEYCCFENMSFASGGGTGVACFDLDWNGTGSVGLQGNIFTNCGFGNRGGGAADYGFRIAFSGHGGANNQFYSVPFGSSTVAGLVTWSASATGNSVQGGGSAQCATGYWIKAGQISSISDAGLADNTGQDFLMDSDGPILLKGNRTESLLSCVFNSATSVAVLDGHSCASTTVGVEMCRTKGKVILDSCAAGPSAVFCSNATYTGKIYVRGCYFPNASYFTAFAGTFGQGPI